ncbi:hypothetical protein M5689_014715 [Euphorbia peplus]|nr:hypothetical protein M5689_014715 [Euphorbia peplus]
MLYTTVFGSPLSLGASPTAFIITWTAAPKLLSFRSSVPPNVPFTTRPDAVSTSIISSTFPSRYISIL